MGLVYSTYFLFKIIFNIQLQLIKDKKLINTNDENPHHDLQFSSNNPIKSIDAYFASNWNLKQNQNYTINI